MGKEGHQWRLVRVDFPYDESRHFIQYRNGESIEIYEKVPKLNLYEDELDCMMYNSKWQKGEVNGRF